MSLETVFNRLKKKSICVDFPPTNAIHVADLQPINQYSVGLTWCSGTTREKRMSFAYEHSLGELANHDNDIILFIDDAQKYAVLEYVRIGLNAKTNFEIFGENAQPITHIYMIPNESTLLLGINGEIGCGKSTVVEYLANNYGFREYMFAMPLKEIAINLGFEQHQVYGTQEQKLEINQFWGISGREFLQKFGTEVCRDHLPKVLPAMNFNGLTMWVRLFEKHLQDHPHKNMAVSDVRFADESQTVKKHGGLIVRIVRTNISNEQPLVVQRHASEMQAASIEPNVIIYNNDTLEVLYKKLDLLIDLVTRGFITPQTRELSL